VYLCVIVVRPNFFYKLYIFLTFSRFCECVGVCKLSISLKTLELRRLKFGLLQIIKISRSVTLVDDKIIIFRTDSLTKGDFNIFKSQCKKIIMYVRIYLHVVLSTVGIVCLIVFVVRLLFILSNVGWTVCCVLTSFLM